MRLRLSIILTLACGLVFTACSNEEKKAETTPEQTTPVTNPPAKETPKTEISVGSGGAEVKTKEVNVKIGDEEKKPDGVKVEVKK